MSMTEHTFSLIPFPDPNIPDLTITGRVGRQNNLLTIQYLLTGETEKVVLPARSGSPMRKDGLWSSTCFEFFLTLPDNPHYWEFNMSPSGDWNVYRMDAYRRVGFREERSIQWLQFEVSHEAGCVSMNMDVDLNSLIPENHSIRLGITSVVQIVDGRETYWALTHSGASADFHTRDGFLIHL
jgi:hypothetical protein